MSINPSPELNSLFQTALREFESRAGTNLVRHQVFNRLRTCQSVDSVFDVLHEQTQAFCNYRGNDGKLMVWIKRIVQVLHSLSISGVLGEGVGLAFPPAKAVFAGIAILLSAIKDIDNTYDALVNLFESFESFLKRLEIYTEIPSTTAITEIITKILIELLNTISLVIQQLKQGRLKKLGKKLLGENDVELVLQRLNRLTLEESRMIGTQTLEVVYGLVKNMRIVMDNGSVLMNDIHHALVMIQQVADNVNKSTRDELQKNVREWLCPPDPSINHNTARQAHHEGSAEWFIHENNTFAQWKSSTGSLLWIYGKPGSGKTILSSSIIEEITRICKAGLATTAFFYFDFKDETKKTSRGALSSLLLQLAAQSDVYSKNLSALYSEHDAGSKQPSEYALKQCFRKMLTVSGQGPIYIVMDALDECPTSAGTPSPRENVLSLVEWMLELHCPRLSVCVTSRPEADIEAILQPLAPHYISLHFESGQNEDITNYIKWFVNSDPKARKWKREDKEYVIEKLSERADGMFRWAFCQLDRLRRCLPPRIRQALDELPATLDETYERTLLDIDEENWAYAHRLFQCLVVSFRPLRVEELAELLAVKFEEGRAPIFLMDWRSEDPRDRVLSTCSSLIAVVDVDGSAIVQFSHFSVKEYLTSARIAEGQVLRYHIPLEPAHTLITQACLSILLQLDGQMTKEQIKDFPLAGYAARYWVEHAKANNVLSQTEDMAKCLFDPRDSHFSAWVRIHDIDIDERWFVLANAMSPRWVPPPDTLLATPLYYAALCGFHGVAEWLINTHSQDVNAWGGRRYDTPLQAASAGGSAEVVRLLLSHNADVNIRGKTGSTALHYASEEGHVMASRILLDWGADVNPMNKGGKTPLLVASGYGPAGTSMEVVELLLGRGADPNVRDGDGWSPIYVALKRDRLDIAHLLLRYGADPNARDDEGRTLLHLASQEGEPDAARGLLELGVDVNSRDSEGKTPLRIASDEGHDSTVQVLNEHGADAYSEDNSGWAPIHGVWMATHPGLRELWSTHDPNPDTLGDDDETPLDIIAQLARDDPRLADVYLEVAEDEEEEEDWQDVEDWEDEVDREGGDDEEDEDGEDDEDEEDAVE